MPFDRKVIFPIKSVKFVTFFKCSASRQCAAKMVILRQKVSAVSGDKFPIALIIISHRQGGAMPANYNLFISHCWEYDDAYNRLICLLRRKEDFVFKNFSVPKDDPLHKTLSDRDLYHAIYNHIRPSSVVLVLAGVYATHSKWINQEIIIAKQGFQSPKPIIAVKPRGQIRISSIVRKHADELVAWNTDSVIAAIHKWG